MLRSTSIELQKLLDCPRVQRWVHQDEKFAAKVKQLRSLLDLADEQVIEIMAVARGQDDDQIKQIAVSGSNIKVTTKKFPFVCSVIQPNGDRTFDFDRMMAAWNFTRCAEL